MSKLKELKISKVMRIKKKRKKRRTRRRKKQSKKNQFLSKAKRWPKKKVSPKLTFILRLKQTRYFVVWEPGRPQPSINSLTISFKVTAPTKSKSTKFPE